MATCDRAIDSGEHQLRLSLRHDMGHDGISGATCGPAAIRWSVQEIRRIGVRLAQRCIRPAHVIAWSMWRRAHQAAARKAHLRRKMRL
jgi:hypothetical protein